MKDLTISLDDPETSARKSLDGMFKDEEALSEGVAVREDMINYALRVKFEGT